MSQNTIRAAQADTITERAMPTVKLGGFQTVACTRERFAKQMSEDCLRARLNPGKYLPKLAFSSNGQGIALAHTDPSFSDIMKEADYIHADGMPVVFASRRTELPLPERIATTDFIYDASRSAIEHGLRFYFLG